MKEIKSLLTNIVKDLYNLEVQVNLSRSENTFGDFSTNVAMQLSKDVSKAPEVIASEIIKIIPETDKYISKAEVAGPGFINIWLKDEVLLNSLDNLTDIELVNKNKKILVEYSDPNPFKPLHAGHLYTTLVGNAIAKLLEKSGGDIVRLNYGGDVGLHVGKVMWAIIQEFGGEHPDKLVKIPEIDRSKWMGERYVEGSKAYEDDPKAKREIVEVNKRVYGVHTNNDKTSDFAKLYWTAREWSYEYFKKLYKELKVESFDRFIPESEVFEIGINTVKEQLEKGVFKKSEGAIVYKGEKKGLHTRVFINSEGLPTYEAKDLGLIELKWRDYHFDNSIIITANEQVQYMQVVLASVAEYNPEIASKSHHLTHGMVKLTGGNKMSSRKGKVVMAQDIIESAKQAAAKQDRGADTDIVLSAIKYAFAKVKIGGDIIYNPEESIALEGNSGPYLQYAYARAKAILRKSKILKTDIDKLEKGERALVVKMSEYKEIVQRAIIELAPHLVTTYLHELAQEFNRFYESNRVIGDDRQDARLFLVSKYAEVLKDGLNLLGINAPEKM